MRLSRADLDLLSAQAGTLHERLAGGYVGVGGGEAAALRRLSRWRHLAAGDDSQKFAGILAGYGWQAKPAAELLTILGEVKREPELPWPDWAEVLGRLVERISSPFSVREPLVARGRSADLGDSRVPFACVYRPVASWARECVQHAHPDAVSGLGERAWRGLQVHLLHRISGVASAGLHTAFLAHRALAGSSLLEHLFSSEQKDGAGNPARLYRRFAAAQLEDGLRSYFLRWPAAARLVAVVTQFWIEAVGEFLLRLQDDRAALSVRFGAGRPLGRVASIRAGVSDAHRRGRGVWIVHFEGGATVVYKPRPLRVDQIFSDLVAALNSRGSAPDLSTPTVLDCGSHGWVEFVRAAPCQGQRAARTFYRRAGALTCLVHWLRGLDCHRENLVAAGAYPVLIDLESLAHPSRPDELVDGDDPSVWRLANSVVRTGLLPLWQPGLREDGWYDLSALGAPVAFRSAQRSLLWRHINTDAMDASFQARMHRHTAHRPRLHGQMLSVHSFEQEVLLGYGQMAALLTERRAAAFDPFRVIIHSVARRRIKRPTALYGLLLRRSLRPECLASGVDRSIELQALPAGASDARERVAEVYDLESLDVPYFQTDANLANSSCICPAAPPDPGTQKEIVRLAVQRRLRLENGQICVN